jgi:hypothetical protein
MGHASGGDVNFSAPGLLSSAALQEGRNRALLPAFCVLRPPHASGD